MMLLCILLLLSTILYCSESHLCIKNQHKNGTWKAFDNPDSLRKSFHCCGARNEDAARHYANDDYLHDTDTCGTEKSGWEISVGSTQHETHTAGFACACDIKEGRYTVNRRERYEWLPDSCTLHNFNGEKFCELLGNRTILFVGDSTMMQSATTVMSMITRHGGRWANQLTFARSYGLYYVQDGTHDLYYFIRQFKPDICIMTAGVHQGDVGDMYSVLENLKNKWKTVLSWSPKTKYYWKTMNPAHAGCANSTEPIKVFVNKRDKVNNWFNFLSYDTAAYEYASRMNYTVIDMSPLYLRPDAHADCLHYCVPGPLNLLGNIMLTMLQTGEM